MLARVPRIEVVPTAALADRAAAVRRLLDDAFGDGFTDDDWAHCLGGAHVLAVDGDAVVGHAAVVPRPLYVGPATLRAGYVEGVATAPAWQRRGVGTLVMREAAALVRAAYDLGALSTGAHAFYERLGWERWRGPTYVRRGAERVRTPDEDDGVMVLRVGATPVDLAAPIACDERPGDDW